MWVKEKGINIFEEKGKLNFAFEERMAYKNIFIDTNPFVSISQTNSLLLMHLKTYGFSEIFLVNIFKSDLLAQSIDLLIKMFHSIQCENRMRDLFYIKFEFMRKVSYILVISLVLHLPSLARYLLLTADSFHPGSFFSGKLKEKEGNEWGIRHMTLRHDFNNEEKNSIKKNEKYDKENRLRELESRQN